MKARKEQTRTVSRRGALTRSVLAVAGIFSGARALGILCSIVKTKLVSLWLGAEGVGLFGIYNSTVDTVATLTGMELRGSSVREVALCRGNREKLALIATVVRRWSVLAGVLGAVVISAISPLLSEWFFGTAQRWWEFAILSGCLLLNAALNGEQAVMQGSGAVSDVARASVWASVAGLAVSVPMYRYLGLNSVMLSLLAYSAAGLVCTLYYRVRTRRCTVSGREMIHRGGFVKLGICMAAAAFVANVATLLFLGWLNARSGTAEVGYYQAGNTLVVRYVGLIFGAVAMEFYPRLSANSFSPKRMSLFVSHEIVLLLLLLCPVTMLFILFRHLIVSLLYAPGFEVIVPMISWLIIGSTLRALSFCMAYCILARGDGKTYIMVESLDCCVGLALNILFYRALGLAGIGVAYIAWYAFYSLLTGIVYAKRYRLSLGRKAAGMVVLSIGCGLGALAIVELLPAWVGYAVIIPVSMLFAVPVMRLAGRGVNPAAGRR